MAIGEFVDPDGVTPSEDSVGGRPLLETRTEDVGYVREVKKSSLFFSLSLKRRYNSSSGEDSNQYRGTPVLMRSLEGASGSSDGEEAEEAQTGILAVDPGTACGRCGGIGDNHSKTCPMGVRS